MNKICGKENGVRDKLQTSKLVFFYYPSKLFFNNGSPCRVYLFDHLQWSIFQSSITHYITSCSELCTNMSFSKMLFHKSKVSKGLWYLSNSNYFHVKGLD